MATSAGVFLALAPWAMLVGAGIWLGVVLATRIVSVASILAALSIPVVVYLTPHEGGDALVGFTVALALFVLWAHRSNVRRLVRGEEHRFGRSEGRHVVPPVDQREPGAS